MVKILRVIIFSGLSFAILCSAMSSQLYRVQKGDSLWTISKKFNLSINSLKKANKLTEKSILQINQELLIPNRESHIANLISQKRTSQRMDSQQQIYYIRKGDSLWTIAKKFRVSVSSLKKANKVTEKTILQINDKLIIPKPVVVYSHKNKLNYAKKLRKIEKPTLQATQLVEDKPQAGSSLPDEGTKIVQTALKYRGIRYRYGGTTSRGFDCSGFVYRILKSHGISVPHSASGIYKYGKPVSRQELKPGDLVFFNTRGRRLNHVGIYIGDGKFVHSSSHHRRGVTIDSLDHGPYARQFVGARRLP